MFDESRIIFHNIEYFYKGDFQFDLLQLNPSCLVAIQMHRNPELLFFITYLFKKKIPFLMIDPAYPEDRIRYMLENSKATIHITDNFTMRYLNEHKDTNSWSDTAYVIYTSGTTGNPKGVIITRDALFNFVKGISEIIDFSSEKKIACLTTVSFDIIFLESIMALSKGLTVVLASEEEQYNPKLMAKLIQKNNVDMIQMTPSTMQLLLNYDKELSCLKDVKEIMIGGEPFPFSLLQILQKKTTAKIYNMYGPTETTIWSAVSDLTCKKRIDIGHPIKNTEIYIVDKNLCILPNGQTGEICIAGQGLAKGYLDRDDLTTEKFVYLPQKPNVRVYRTGDLGRYLSDGELEYLGRTDNQVKIRGHRIELEEIEANLNQFEGINQSIVIVIETSKTDKVLKAFYTSDNHIETKDIISNLSQKLPDYMIPAIFKRVENFIYTGNGKIDRKKVFQCVEIREEKSLSKDWNTTELNDTQAKIFQVIVSNLNSEIGDVSLGTFLSDVGIDSITFIKMIVALEGEFGFEFDDEMLLITSFPTIKSMIKYVETKIDISRQTLK